MGFFPKCQLPKCQLPECQLPKSQLPEYQLPKTSTPKMSTPKNLYFDKMHCAYLHVFCTAPQTGNFDQYQAHFTVCGHGMVLSETWRKWTILMISRSVHFDS